MKNFLNSVSCSDADRLSILFVMSDWSDREHVWSSYSWDNETNFFGPLGPKHPLLVAVNISIACLALLGNGLVITVMLARRSVFSSTVNRLILHQSIIDAITAVVFFLQKIFSESFAVVSVKNTFFDEFLCRVLYSDFFLWFLYVTSTYNIVIISLDRFMATVYPLKHRKLNSSNKVKFAIAVPWGIGFAHSFQFVFVYQPNQGLCEAVPRNRTFLLVSTAIVVSIEYVVPITILLYTYTGILITLKRRKTRPVSGRQDFFRRAKTNVLKIVVLVGSAFIICWAPAEVDYVLARVFYIYSSEPIYNAFIVLVSCNTAINPIIYCFTYEHFRAQLKDVLGKGLGRN